MLSLSWNAHLFGGFFLKPKSWLWFLKPGMAAWAWQVVQEGQEPLLGDWMGRWVGQAGATPAHFHLMAQAGEGGGTAKGRSGSHQQACPPTLQRLLREQNSHPTCLPAPHPQVCWLPFPGQALLLTSAHPPSETAANQTDIRSLCAPPVYLSWPLGSQGWKSESGIDVGGEHRRLPPQSCLDDEFPPRKCCGSPTSIFKHWKKNTSYFQMEYKLFLITPSPTSDR